jgi:dihydrofolate synthase/folylpolyglutamate synthase
LVRPEGFEPPTLCSEDRCSNPLSYGRLVGVYYFNREEQGKTVQPINNFKQANQYLSHFYEFNRSETAYNLNNILSLLDYLGNPQNRLKIIHVAGTSGKTSTSYYMASLLMAAGNKTGLTVSPHIDEVNERVQINGLPLGEAMFCPALTEFAKYMQNAPVQPSWFEVIIAFAFWYFDREAVDFAVIEVGVGGLKDATNVISRSDKICIITDIGYDHMRILGHSLAGIAAQKAGIIQPHNEVFMYKQPEEIMKTLENSVAAQKAKLHVVKEVSGNDTKMPDYQFRNWQLARNVYSFISKRDNLADLPSQSLLQSQQILIPGRMDGRRHGDKLIIMDGAHNVQKMTALVNSFKKLYPDVKPAVLISMKQGKEYEQVIPLVAPLASRIITTDFELNQDLHVRSMDAKNLASTFSSAGVGTVLYIRDQAMAVNSLLEGPETVCLITGSLYLLGQLRNKGLI